MVGGRVDTKSTTSTRYDYMSSPKSVLDKAREIDKNVTLWCQYNDTYIDIQRDPYKRSRMRNDEGVKFMEKGWRIVGWICVVLYFIGVYGG